ncbi:MAG: small ribosomal subunit Rsm22 family protein [Bryobacteraceae bacterium]
MRLLSNIGQDKRVHLPADIQTQIELYAQGIPQAVLEKAVAQLSDHYRAGMATGKLRMDERERIAAYLLTRFPATYAAVTSVLAHTGVAGVETLLDLGAGAGAAALAARERFPAITRMTLIEKDAASMAAGRAWLPNAGWVAGNFAETAFAEHDAVVASYALGELKPAPRMQALDRAWKAARQFLILVEPGSTAGFTVIRECRDRLLEAGGHMIAPCPGEMPCPIAGKDWCHFAARLERSRLHRRLKHGQLSYEDEKYSYVILSKAPADACAGRIIRRPTHQPGLIELTVCSGGKIAAQRINKRDRNKFAAARRADWGDSWQ